MLETEVRKSRNPLGICFVVYPELSAFFHCLFARLDTFLIFALLKVHRCNVSTPYAEDLGNSLPLKLVR